MAVRCSTEVTVIDQTDATAIVCWYQLSSSATLPARPTTTDASATPAGWQRSEPTISGAEDAAKYVYACWQTVWGDGTCDWGDVSMSASFEAAKVAYNKAASVQTEMATEFEKTNEAITLRATKTEAYQVAQPNLSPLTQADLTSVYNATTNPNGYWRLTPSTAWFTQLEDGWIRVYRDNSAGTAAVNTTYFRPRACPSIVPGGTYTILIEVRNNRTTGSGDTDMYIQQTANNQFWGSGGGNIQPLTFGEETVIHSKKVADTAHLTDGTPSPELFRYNARCAAGSVLDFELRLSIYEGEYSGPYKPYVGAQLYASQAQLKVANDAITSKVSTTDYNGETVASLINQSADSVKIQAGHVDVEGAAIFTSGRLSQDALDEAMSGNLLGNTRNGAWTDLNCSDASLTYGDAAPYNTSAASRSVEAYDDGSKAAVISNDTATGNRGVGWYTKRGAVKAGVTYAFSCMVWASCAVVVHTHTGWRTSEASAYSGWVSEGNRNVHAETWTLYTHSFTPSASADLTWEFFAGICYTGNKSGVTFKVAHAKLEEGGVATPWGGVAAVEVGGGNLLRSSDVWEQGTWNTSSGAHTASTTRLRSSKGGWYVPVEPNATYVIGRHTAGSPVDYYMVLYAYDSSGAFVLTDSVTGWITSFPYTYVPATATRLEVGIRRSDNADISASEAEVARFKLERGNRASDWTPAPEDVAASAVSRTQRIWYRSDGSEAPAAPTAWVTKTDDGDAAWTKMHVAISATHRRVYTCEQYEMADGTPGTTTVLLDNTITVIDGGNIITGSVQATSLDVYDAEIGKIRADAVDAENLKVPFANFTDADEEFSDLAATINGINDGYQSADETIRADIDGVKESLDGYQLKADAESQHAALASDVASASTTATEAKDAASAESAWRAARFSDGSGVTDFHADGGTVGIEMGADYASVHDGEQEVARMGGNGLSFDTGTIGSVLNLGANLAIVVLDDGDVVIKGIG